MSNNTIDLKAIFDQIVAAELPIVKQPLINFAAALEAPDANFLTVQNAATNVLLTFPQLSEPTQAALLKVIGVALTNYINSIGTSSSSGSGTSSASGSGTPPAPAPLVSSENGGSVVA